MDALNWDLLNAAIDGDLKAVEACLKHGANVNCKDEIDWTPLHRAALGGHTDTASLLISLGADINIKDGWAGQTPLHWTADRGHTETAALLASMGADINSQDYGKWTPLHLAALGDHTDTVHFLISNGADSNIQSVGGQTAFGLSKGKTKILLQTKSAGDVIQALTELRGIGMETAGDFQDIMTEGTYKCFWNRVYLVGPYSVGKSTLAKILVDEPLPLERESTDGIWIYMGRAGMDVDQKTWKFFPKGAAITEILTVMLMSLTNKGTNSIQSEVDPPVISKTSVNPEKHAPGNLQSAPFSNKIYTEKTLNDTPSPVQSKVIPEKHTSASTSNIDLPKRLPDITTSLKSEQVTTKRKVPAMVPSKQRSSQDKTPQYPSKSKSSVSMSNIKIHKQVIETIKDGKYKQKIIPIDIWDFGGQKDYYMTHQLFITSRGIYVLMFNGSVDLHKIMSDLSFLPGHFGRPTVAVYLLHWVNSILTYCKRTDDGFPKIIFVATHKDMIKPNKIELRRTELMESIYELFKSHAGLTHLEYKPLIFINGKDNKDHEIEKLRSRLIERAVQHPRWGEEMPTAWVPLELQLAEKVEEGTNIISRQDIEKLNLQNKPMILSEKQLNTFLRVQHSLGKLLYFDESKLRDYIVINPAYMVEVLRSIVTEKQFWPKGEKYKRIQKKMQKTGMIGIDDIYFLWNQSHFQHILPHKEHMAGMLVHLDILVEPRKTREDLSVTTTGDVCNKDYLVPCMITKPNCTHYVQKFCLPTKSIILAYTFIEEVIPPALAYRFVGSFMTMWNVKIYEGKSMLFSDLAVVDVDENHDVTVQVKKNRVVVTLIHSRKREDIVPTLASSIQECLTAAVHRISEFYSTLSGDESTPTLKEINSKTGGIIMPFNIEFGVVCKGFLRKPTMCFFSQKDLEQPWTCPTHNRKHDVRILKLWYSEQIPLERCPESCTGLNKFRLELPPTDQHLCRVVKTLKATQFPQIVTSLGLTENDLDLLVYEFKHQNPQNMMFEALLRWKELQREPTFALLQKVLIEYIEDVHKLCQVFRDIDPDTTGLTEDVLNKRLTQSALEGLLNHIGDNVMQLGVELGLRSENIKHIQREHKDKLLDQARAVLKRWMEHTRKPTVRTLIKALHRIGKINCIQKLKF